MNEFKITVEIPGLSEAITALANALGQPQDRNADQPDTTTTPRAEETPVEVSQSAPTAPAAPAPTEEKKRYTLEDLSRAGAALIDQGKMPQLLGLLEQHGVKAVTQLSIDAYPAFAEALRALGASL